MKRTPEETSSLISYGIICAVGGAAGMAMVKETAGGTFNGATLASWVQAVGSVAAIFAAIWVSKDQHAKALERTRLETRQKELRLIRSLRAEVRALWIGYQRTIGQTLSQSPPGKPFLHKWPVNPNPFMVYTANAGDIALIEDERLRYLFVVTYARASGLLSSYAFNNEMLDQLDQAGGAPLQTGPILHRLAKYRDQLHLGHTNLAVLVAQLLDAWTEPNPEIVAFGEAIGESHATASPL